LAAADVPQRQQAHGYANLRRAVFDARDAAADVELRIKQRNPPTAAQAAHQKPWNAVRSKEVKLR